MHKFNSQIAQRSRNEGCNFLQNFIPKKIDIFLSYSRKSFVLKEIYYTLHRNSRKNSLSPPPPSYVTLSAYKMEMDETPIGSSAHYA